MALIGEMQYLTIGGNTYSLPSGGGGSVSSVAVSNATNGGLSVSGSPISSSGTITIGHSNVLSSAQTTQAVYPIKIDKNGHISAYGTAVTIPTVNNATLTIQKNGTTINTFTANASSDVTANITVPTKVSELTNDSGYITSYTDTKLQVSEINSNTQYYPIVGTGTTAATRQYDTNGFLYKGITGTTSSVGLATIALGNNTKSGTANNKKGQIQLYGPDDNYLLLEYAGTSNNRTITFPDKAGTVALTSDIPTVELFLTSGTKTASISIDGTRYDLYAPTPNVGTITSVKTTAGAHTAIDVSSGAANFNIPTKTSHLTNDSGFITSYTDEKLKVAEVTSGYVYYPIVGINTAAATRQYDTTGLKYVGQTGTAGALGYATLTLGNSTASGTANNKQGQLIIYGSTAYAHTINGAPTGARVLTLPDKTGTIALTSDIPDVSGKIDTAGTGLSKSGTTLNHSNSVTAQTTQAVYPIKIDAQGHISAYGSAQTILSIGTTSSTAAAGNHTHDIGLGSTTDTTSGVTLASATKYKLTAGGKSVYFTMPTIPTVSYPVTSVNNKTGAVSLTASDVGALASGTTYVSTVTTTAGAHTAISSKSGAVSFNVPTTAAHVGAATSDHTHGNITNGGDITATAPTIASGDQIIINDNSASKITNGPTFDGSTTTKALSQKGTWETFSNSLLYGECTIAAATAAKTVTVDSSFKLETGATVAVKFSNSNTASSPTLNVNSTGAKTIYRYGTTSAGTTAQTSWSAESVVCFVFDGTGWRMMDWQNDNTMVTQNHSTSTSVYNMALANYSSSSGGTSTLNHSNKIQANPSTGDTLQSGRATTADLSSSDVTTFVNSLNYSQINAVDYVVEEGTSGSWHYRKWNSGIGECWLSGYNPGSYTCGTTRGSLYSGGNLSLTFPVTFTSYPAVTGSVSLGTDAYVVWLQFNALSTTTAQCRIVSSGSVAANSSYLISVHATGQWK